MMPGGALRGVIHCPSCLAETRVVAGHCFACGALVEPALARLADGALFASRYEIQGLLGRGGMGMVYRAYDRELSEPVAIKVLRPDVARESGRVVQRFRSEIRLARRVRHRNVCSVYGDGEDGGLLFICMELLPGENLARPVREAGGLPRDEAWDVVLQVACGLVAIHEVGVVHRDLKTANLMRDAVGVVRVMDFGIAKSQGDSETRVTASGSTSLMGTPEYMSPEQLRGQDVDARSDLYSLAIVAYELFTGELPLRGETPVATIVRQLQDAPDLGSPKLPPALRPVIARALAKGPDERFASASEMMRALERARLAPAGAAHETTVHAVVPPDDDTRPVDVGSLPEAVPVLRLALVQAAVLALAAHLVGAAGGIREQPSEATPPQGRERRVVPTKTAPAPDPASGAAGPGTAPSRAAGSLAAAAAPSMAAVSPARGPSPRPRLRNGAKLSPSPDAPRVPASSREASSPPRGRDRGRVYLESEVDVKPRRIAGSSAPYPEWGPPLPRGERVSIEASFVVTETGDVTDIRVEKGGGSLQAVLLEMSRWRYEPGTRNGLPVKVRLRFRHTYVG